MDAMYAIPTNTGKIPLSFVVYDAEDRLIDAGVRFVRGDSFGKRQRATVRLHDALFRKHPTAHRVRSTFRTPVIKY